ncbi:MAG: hypothetical protein ACE5G8_16575, partial [Anaerolineae bacterium]
MKDTPHPHLTSTPRRAAFKTPAAGLAGLLALAVAAWAMALPGPASRPALAQSTADTIGAGTPTTVPTPALTPTPTPAPAEPDVWLGRVVEVMPQVILGGGAIVRVYVTGLPGELIELRQAETVLSAVAGSKEEYGPFAAEFAPVPGGEWLVTLPRLGSSFTLQTDFNSLFVIEFAPVPASQATAAAQTPPTATPPGGAAWAGRVVGRAEGPS